MITVSVNFWIFLLDNQNLLFNDYDIDLVITKFEEVEVYATQKVEQQAVNLIDPQREEEFDIFEFLRRRKIDLNSGTNKEKRP